MTKKIRIGQLLLSRGLITQDQLDKALAAQKNTRRKLGKTLIDLGFISEAMLAELLSKQLGIPYVDIRHYKVDLKLVQRLPEVHARRFRALVLTENPRGYIVAMADPLDIVAADEIKRILRKPVRPAMASEDDLLRALDSYYTKTEAIQDLAEELQQELGQSDVDLDKLVAADDEASDATVARLVQSLFEDAVRVRASDIHIEPGENLLRIRQRIDGVLCEHVMKNARIAPALVSRLKLMAKLDISEKRLPQDGRFHIRVKGREIDVRLSTMPIQYGESVVMRLLDQSKGLGLDEIGMPPQVLERFRELLRKPHGMILVTGPTGSGKTTTLYGGLSELNQPERKIITVEDPVEYRLPRINQVQVNTKIGLTFASVLRTALRQDPDVVLVGEIRDQETAEIALRAAMTGHLLLATLHTNDAISTAMRLADMGAEGFLLAASLEAVIAQRLMRKLCPDCAVPHEPSEREKLALVTIAGPSAADKIYAWGRGCTVCNNTGYRGRIGIYELLEIDAPMADALRRNDTAAYVNAAQNCSHFRSLAQCAYDVAQEGQTSVEEVFRVTGGVDDDRDMDAVEHVAAQATTSLQDLSGS